MENQGSNEPGWLVKNFDVLYRAASELLDALDLDLESKVCDRVESAAGFLRGQLQRLAPAWGQILVMKATAVPTVANQDRAAGKGD